MKYFIALILLALVTPAMGQREYGECDSTFYTLNADTTVIAGSHKLYLSTAAGVTPLADFTDADTANYIRDFDIIHPSLWYTLVGLKYIGGPTFLYKSTDRGQTWVADTSYYASMRYHPGTSVVHTNYNSVNRVQVVAGRIILFVGYYESGLAYSEDNGATWHQWFWNMIVHYQGMLECGDYFFLYGFEGDAFKAVMFPIHKSLMFTPDTGGAWYTGGHKFHPPCPYSTHAKCIFATPSLTRCQTYQYFLDTLPGVCATLPVSASAVSSREVAVTVQPNPAHEYVAVSLPENMGNIISVRMIDAVGREHRPIVTPMSDNRVRADVRQYPPGLYMMLIASPEGTVARKVMIE